jgi:hypothetical protein
MEVFLAEEKLLSPNSMVTLGKLGLRYHFPKNAGFPFTSPVKKIRYRQFRSAENG